MDSQESFKVQNITDGDGVPPYQDFKSFVAYINLFTGLKSFTRDPIEIANCIKVLHDWFNKTSSPGYNEIMLLGLCYEDEVINFALKKLKDLLKDNSRSTGVYQAIEGFCVRYLSHIKQLSDSNDVSDIFNKLHALLRDLLEDVSNLVIEGQSGLTAGLRALVSLTLVFRGLRLKTSAREQKAWEDSINQLEVKIKKSNKHIDENPELAETLSLIKNWLTKDVFIYSDVPLSKKGAAADATKAVGVLGWAGLSFLETAAGLVLAIPTGGASLAISVVGVNASGFLLVKSIIDAYEYLQPHYLEIKERMQKKIKINESNILELSTGGGIDSLLASGVNALNVSVTLDISFQWILQAINELEQVDVNNSDSNITFLLDNIAHLLKHSKLSNQWRSVYVQSLSEAKFKTGECIFDIIMQNLNQKCITEDEKNKYHSPCIEIRKKLQKNKLERAPSIETESLEKSWESIFLHDVKANNLLKQVKSSNENRISAQNLLILKQKISGLPKPSKDFSRWTREHVLHSLDDSSLSTIPRLLNNYFREIYQYRDYIKHIDPKYRYRLSDKNCLDCLSDDFFELKLQKQGKENELRRPLENWATDLFKKDQNKSYLLIAPSGAGKTTLMHRMFAKVLEHLEKGSETVWLTRNGEPAKHLVLLKCKDINAAVSKSDFKNLNNEAQISKMLYETFFRLLFDAELEQSFITATYEFIEKFKQEADNVILLLDAYDELNSVSAKNIAIKLLDKFKNHIVSTRFSVLKEIKNYEDYDQIYLQGLSSENQRKYINSYFYNNPKKAGQAINLLEKISEKGGFPAELPLCLDALCFALDDESSKELLLQDNIHIINVYTMVIYKLFRWNQESKHEEMHTEYNSYSMQWSFLRHLAYKSLKQNQEVTKYDCREAAKKIGLDESDISKLVASGLLVHGGDNYRFIHAQYQAFLAAYEFAVKLFNDKSENHQVSLKELLDNYKDSFYRPVWKFLIELIMVDPIRNHELPDLKKGKNEREKIFLNFIENIKKQNKFLDFHYYLLDLVLHFNNMNFYDVIKDSIKQLVRDVLREYNNPEMCLIKMISCKYSKLAIEVINDNRIYQVSLKAKIEDEYVPLHRAIHYHLTEVALALLVKKGIDFNLQDKIGYTPLHKAIHYHEREVALALLAKKDIAYNLQDKIGYTPLHRAIHYHEREVALTLLAKNDISYNLQDNSGYTPLHKAIHYHEREVALALLAQKDIAYNLQDNHGYTPLHRAIHSHERGVALVLLAKKDIAYNLQDNRGYAPLHKAIYCSETNVALTLFTKGAKFGEVEKTWLIDFAKKQNDLEFFTPLESKEEFEINTQMSDDDIPQLAKYLLKKLHVYQNVHEMSQPPQKIIHCPKIKSLKLTEEELLLVRNENQESIENWNIQLSYLINDIKLRENLQSEQARGALSYFETAADQIKNNSPPIYKKIMELLDQIKNINTETSQKDVQIPKISQQSIFSNKEASAPSKQIKDLINNSNQQQIDKAIVASLSDTEGKLASAQ